MSNNPLLEHTTLPLFKQIEPKHIKPALEAILADNRKQLQQLLKIYNQCQPLLIQYHIEFSHNKKFYAVIKQIAASPDFKKLSLAQKKAIQNSLRDFKLAGAELTGKNKKRFAELQQQLTKLSTKFEENVLDVTNAWFLHLKQKNKLTGLPALILQTAKAKANQKKLTGWLFTLDIPTYMAVMSYAEDRNLRKTFYEAYTTRASDQGPHNKKWDNSKVMLKILDTRLELAKLLGFKNYAELSLITKIASSSHEVITFLNDLVKRAKPQALLELKTLERFAKKQYQVDKLEAWDINFYAEKLKLHQFNISDEQLRPYFPESIVMQGLFTIVSRLYGLHITEIKNCASWHPSVRLYQITDANQKLIAYFYTDLYARSNKRGGALMAECRTYLQHADSSKQIPAVFLTCNFSQPVGDNPCLMTHDEVTTLFHEFGHCLHHLLSTVPVAAVSGINGVSWDAVEQPSQFMENWCWEQEALTLISKHYQTQKSLPHALLKKLISAKNFHSALMMLRQLEFSLFDFELHCHYKSNHPNQIQSLLDKIREQIAVITPPVFNRFQHSFSHIFAGGYAAGYYSYKWAEVLSSDAYSRFEEEGIFNPETGKSFKENILQRGGEADAMELFKKFRGRAPKIDSLLRHNGIK